MADAKPGAPQNLIYSMILEQAKNTAENNLLLRAILEELQELNSLIAQAPSSGNTIAPEPSSSSSDVPATTTAPPGGGMEAVLEQMICEEMGVSPEMLRTGKLDASALRAMLKAKKEAASSTPPT